MPRIDLFFATKLVQRQTWRQFRHRLLAQVPAFGGRADVPLHLGAQADDMKCMTQCECNS